MRDALGNDLKIGDLVAMQLERPMVYGRVVEIHEGGIVTGLKHGGTEMAPGSIVVISRHPLMVDPRLPVGAVVALRDPHPEDATVIQEAPEKFAVD